MDDLSDMENQNEKIKSTNVIKYIIEREQSPNDPTDIKFDIQECNLNCDWLSYVKDTIFERHLTKNRTISDGKIRQTIFITYDAPPENQECHSGTFPSNFLIQNGMFEQLNDEDELTDRNGGNPNQKEKLLELIMKINDNFSDNVQTVEYYECLYCEFNTKNEKSLLSHFRQKHEFKGKPSVCRFCGFSSRHEEDLWEHYEVEHNQKKRLPWHKCKLCNYHTKCKSWLSKHVLSTHESDKQPQLHKCKFCNFVTKREHWLRKHVLKKHNSGKGIQKNKCKFCYYTTKSKILLRRHVAREHKLDCEPNVAKHRRKH